MQGNNKNTRSKDQPIKQMAAINPTFYVFIIIELSNGTMEKNAQ
jgi:hypothetical protein